MKTNSSAILVPAPTPQAASNLTLGTDIRDIQGPVDIPSGWAWLWWTLGAIVVALVAFLAIRRWLRLRGQPKAPEIIIPPDVRARNRLRAALELIATPLPFCTLVSDTLRVYLEERFSFHAPDRTTEEFLDELQSSPMLSLSQKELLGGFLMQCDMVKFARYEPGEPELRGLYDAAIGLVDETAPPSTLMASNASSGPGSPPSSADGGRVESK